MNVTTIVIIGTLAAIPATGPQDPSPAAAPPQVQTQPAPAQPAQADASRPPVTDISRQDIRMMEIGLLQALQTGARRLAQQLKVREPNSAFVTGTGRARGFILDGYGLFFDVDVPGMKQSVVWSAQTVELVQDRERAIQAVNALRPDDPLRKFAEERVRSIERTLAMLQSGQVLLPPPSPTAPAQLDRGLIEATSVVPVAGETVGAASPIVPAAPAAAQQAPQIRDPNELYTEAVKTALIDAMLQYGRLFKIADQEWLTVAASDGDGPQVPGQLDETSRILISIRGSDLSALQTGKVTRADVLKKVLVREF